MSFIYKELKHISKKITENKIYIDVQKINFINEER